MQVLAVIWKSLTPEPLNDAAGIPLAEPPVFETANVNEGPGGPPNSPKSWLMGEMERRAGVVRCFLHFRLFL